MQCPGCGRNGYRLYVKCDTCGCCFCNHGNCDGTFGSLILKGSGRSPGSLCKACGKGKLKKL